MSDGSTLRVQVAEGLTAEALRTTMAATPTSTVTLTVRVLAQLEREFHGYKRAYRWLLALATEMNQPIGIHADDGEHGRTVFISPRDWTAEKLAGWIAARREVLEAEFGPIDRLEQAS